MALDYLAASLGALAAFGLVFGHLNAVDRTHASFFVAAGYAAATFFPLALRRHHPLAAYAGQLMVALTAAPIDLGLTVALLVLACYPLYLVAVTLSRRTSLIALAMPLALVCVLGFNGRTSNDSDPGATVPVALVLIIAWIAGYSARQRRAYAVSLRDQAASSAVAEERLRIARELHDVVAHSMSVIAVQAGYGQYVMSSSPEDASEALGAIQATSREALEEMRRMLGVLRQQDAGVATELLNLSRSERAGLTPATNPPAPLAPAPGLGDLDRLVARTVGTGVRVDVRTEGTARPLPAGVDLSAYRIVQEALTNVVKHAGTGANCVVVVSCDDDAVSIDVTDDGGLSSGRPPSSVVSGGHGLAGMHERVNLCGGEFSAGPWTGGGFRVSARLPLHDTLQAVS